MPRRPAPTAPPQAATATEPPPRSATLQEQMRFKVLDALQQNPDLTQRQLAALMGVSLGKANYVLRALVDKGLVKAERFNNSRDKLAYAYLLTPQGLAQRAALTRSYLQRKTAEYEALRDEIARLKADLANEA